MERKRLTEGRSAAGGIRRRVSKGQRAKEADRWVKERKDISPGNVGSRVRGSSRVEENAGTKFDVIRGSGSEAMPEEPPTTGWVGKRSVVRMVAKEVAAAMAIGSASRRSRKGLRQINLHKVPTRTKGAGWPVRDEEKAIRG